jgi:hypothetical protein
MSPATGVEPSDQYKIPFLIGVVGHRDLVDGELPAIRAAIHELLERIVRFDPDARATLLCSMADGADLLAADVADSLGIPILALFPYAREMCRADLNNAAEQALFDRLCAGAESIELPLPGGMSAKDLEKPGTARDHQFKRAGAIVARYSALLIAIWDGRDTDHRAGTARVVEFRRRGLVPTDETVMLPSDALLSAEDNDLMFEIRCSRASQPGAPDGVTVPGFTGAQVQAGEGLPLALSAPLKRFAEFNRDVAAFGAEIERHGRKLSIPSPNPVAQNLRYLDRLFTAADWLGGHYRRCFRRAVTTRYVLWSLMAFLLVTFKHEKAEGNAAWSIFGVLAVFALGALFARWAHKRSWHRKYLDCRALAEGLRVDFYWEIAGVRGEFSGEFAHESFLQKQDVELQWIRDAMRAVSLRLAMAPATSFEGGFSHAFAAWVGDDDPVNGTGQLHYYTQRAAHAERKLRAWDHATLVLLAIGMTIALVFGIDVVAGWMGRTLLSGSVREVLLWGLALNTVYAAVVEVYLSEMAERNLVRQYRYMRSLFGVAARALRAPGSHEHKLEILRSLGHACLAEHAQWILAHRDKRIEGLRW